MPNDTDTPATAREVMRPEHQARVRFYLDMLRMAGKAKVMTGGREDTELMNAFADDIHAKALRAIEDAAAGKATDAEFLRTIARRLPADEAPDKARLCRIADTLAAQRAWDDHDTAPALDGSAAGEGA